MATGAGLTGGPITGSGTISVQTAGIIEDHLAASLAFDDGDLLDLSGITANTTTEGLKLPVYNAAATADGQVSWDATNDKLYVGDGTTVKEIGAGGSSGWGLTGNSGLADATNFIGNTDNVPLNFRVFNERGLRIEHTGTAGNTPNIIGGSSNNTVTAGVQGAFIGGGGNPMVMAPNNVSANFATIGGGYGNTASGIGSTVAGGASNTAGGDYSFAAGRLVNINAAYDGSFLFADNSGAVFNSAAANEFAVRAGGGVRFVNAPFLQLPNAGTPGAGKVLTSDASGNGTWQSAAGGDITDVTAGTGLTGGGTTGAVTLNVDTTAIQSRVSGTCAAGSSISTINANGTVVCETDDIGTGDITDVTTASGSGLTGGVTSGNANLQVVVDNSTLEIATNTIQVKDAGITENKLAASLLFDDGDLLNLSAINASSTMEGLILPQATNVSAATAEGQISWDSDNDKLYVGSGTAAKEIGPAWSLTGNAGTDGGTTNFIGTTDNKDLLFKVNNEKAGYLSIDGTGFLNALNTSWGYQALNINMAVGFGNFANTAIGYRALYSNTTGFGNTANGVTALALNTTGYSNTANGGGATLYNNTTGYENTANGTRALYSNTTGYSNTANGYEALFSNTTGIENTANGYYAGIVNTSGNYNTFVGANADASANNLFNATAIGYGAIVNANNKVRIGNGSVTTIEGQVAWSSTSDRRLKTNIMPNDKGLDFISKLQPVTFQWKEGDTDTVYDGFIAQDVESAMNELGITFSGLHKPQNDQDHYSLAYSTFVVPLVNAVKEQQAVIEQQTAEITDLKAKNQQMMERLERLESMILAR